jgi:hypothetical protein
LVPRPITRTRLVQQTPSPLLVPQLVLGGYAGRLSVGKTQRGGAEEHTGFRFPW